MAVATDTLMENVEALQDILVGMEKEDAMDALGLASVCVFLQIKDMGERDRKLKAWIERVAILAMATEYMGG